jgi:ubiquinol-cytochrome c reductase cytochrome c subunit
MAAVAVIAIGLIISGGGYAAATAAVSPKSESPAYTAQQVAEGKKLFLSNCASCHGKNAEGSVDKNGNEVFPTLIGVGAAAVDFQVGTGRMPAQASGPQMMKKTVQFTDAQIADLAAYVESLDPTGPKVPDSKWLTTKTDTVRGGELFRINCAMCHNAAGAGGALTEGKFAPNLAGVTPAHIYEAMITGPQNMPVFSDKNLTPQDKSDIISYLKYLERHPSSGGYELANLGPVVEGLFAWIIVLGLLVLITMWLAAKSN